MLVLEIDWLWSRLKIRVNSACLESKHLVT